MDVRACGYSGEAILQIKNNVVVGEGQGTAAGDKVSCVQLVSGQVCGRVCICIRMRVCAFVRAGAYGCVYARVCVCACVGVLCGGILHIRNNVVVGEAHGTAAGDKVNRVQSVSGHVCGRVCLCVHMCACAFARAYDCVEAILQKKNNVVVGEGQGTAAGD